MARIFEADAPCDDCPNAAPDIDWPSTLTIMSEAGCTDEIDRGSECEPTPPPTSCCGVDVASHSVEYIATVESDCPEIDGITYRLKWASGNIWWNSYSFAPPRSNALPPGKCTPPGDDQCYMALTLSCGENDPGTGDWNMSVQINCSPSGSFCDLDTGLPGSPDQTHNGPIAGTCDPLILTFERTLYTHGPGCNGCATCTYFITITIAP